MLHMIGHILFGLVIGIVAKLLFPGHDPGGFIVTALLGMAGAWLGGYLGRALGWYQPGQPAGFMMAIAGALILLIIYHLAIGRSSGAATNLVPRQEVAQSLDRVHVAPTATANIT